jgi:hypothetical protein
MQTAQSRRFNGVLANVAGGIMPLARIVLSLMGMLIGADAASAQIRTAKHLTATANDSPGFLDAVAIEHRDAVRQVIAKPTLTTKSREESFTMTAAVYAWMLEHPDRVSLAWQRLDVPCVDIVALGKKQFAWTDEHGSKLVWEPVAVIDDGIVWHATGIVKPGALMPPVPVKAVACLRYPGVATKTAGLKSITPELQVWFQTDHKAANALLRIVGPAAPKLAEDGAGQLLYFFSGMGKYLQKNPAAANALLAGK